MRNAGSSQVTIIRPYHSFFLTFFPCSSVETHPRDTVLYKLLLLGLFLQAAVLYKLCQHSCFLWGAVFRNRMFQHEASMGPQDLTEAYSITGCLCCHSFFQSNPPTSVWDPPQATRLKSAGLWTSMGSMTSKLCHHSVHYGLQGNLCSSIWSSSSPSDLVSFTPLCSCCRAAGFYLPKYAVTEALPTSLPGSALASSKSVLELAETGSV